MLRMSFRCASAAFSCFVQVSVRLIHHLSCLSAHRLAGRRLANLCRVLDTLSLEDSPAIHGNKRTNVLA